MSTNWQTWPQLDSTAAFTVQKESKLKLSLETRNRGDIAIVHCHGRIVYRDEAAALSRLVAQIVEQSPRVILDLTGVSSIDSAGIGELALLHTLAQKRNVVLKCAGANALVRSLLDLTRLDSVLEMHDSLDEALASCHVDSSPRREQAWADC